MPPVTSKLKRDPFLAGQFSTRFLGILFAALQGSRGPLICCYASRFGFAWLIAGRAVGNCIVKNSCLFLPEKN